MKEEDIKMPFKQFRLNIPNEWHSIMKKASQKKGIALQNFIMLSALEKAEEVLNK